MTELVLTDETYKAVKSACGGHFDDMCILEAASQCTRENGLIVYEKANNYVLHHWSIDKEGNVELFWGKYFYIGGDSLSRKCEAMNRALNAYHDKRKGN